MRKKILVGFAGLMVVMGLSGCGEQVVVNVDKAKENVPVAKTGDTVAVVPEAKVGDEKKVDEKTNTGDSKVGSYFQTGEVEFSAVKALDNQKMLSPYKANMMKIYQKTLDGYGSGSKADWNEIANYYKFYEVGKLKVAPYDGWKLVNLVIECDGMCMQQEIYRFAWDEVGGKLVYLEKNSSNETAPDHFAALTKNTDSKMIIKALVMPNSIVLQDGVNSVELRNALVDMKINNNSSTKNGNPFGLNFVDLGKVAFEDEKMGSVYMSANNIGCLYVISPDGVVSVYAYDPKLTDEKIYQEIKWNDKSESSYLADHSYVPLAKGCGIGSNCYYLESIKMDQLVEVGKTNKGIIIYASKDTKRVENAEVLGKTIDSNQGSYNLNSTYNNYRDMYQYGDEEAKKTPLMTYEEFLKVKPVIYWQDPFGRFSSMIKANVEPPAECGKPVIYLYPEKTTDVSVKVGIDKLTQSIPDYGNDGWKVKAKPNGELLNYADGQKYTYLFWEGESKKKLGFNQGFVIAKADVKDFLENSLAQMGLNNQESADFMDFWLPKMQAVNQPYLLVSFIGTNDFNKVAPLSISPTPQTLIRVFMYYQPLAEKMQITPQKLSAPARNGFTVVEWGGTSSEPWQIQ